MKSITKSPSSLRARALAGSIAALLGAASAPAVTLTWDIAPGDAGVITDGAGTWTDAAGNWNDGVGDVNWANANPDDAIFGGGTSGTAATVTLSTGITAGSITFNAPFSGAYTIDTATFALTLNTGITANESATIQSGGGSLILGATNTWSVAATKTLAVSSAISGVGFGLTKTDAGTLALSGTNTYDGGTNVNGGVLALGSSGALGTTGTISFGGGALQFSASNTTDYSARFSAAASQAYNLDTNGESVTLASAMTSAGGALTKTGAGALTLSAANTYDGLTTVSGGELRWGINSAVSSSSALTINNGGTANLQTFTGTVNGTTLNQGGAITGGTGSQLATGSIIAIDGGSINMGTGQVLLSGTSLTYNDTIVGSTTLSINRLYIGGARTFTIADGDDVSGVDLDITSYLGFSAAGDSRDIIKEDTGAMRLSGSTANSNRGTSQTLINDGTLLLNKSAAVDAIGATGLIRVGDSSGAAGSAILQYTSAASNDQILNNAITINSDGLLDLNGKNETTSGALTHSTGGSLTTGVGILTLGAATNTISGTSTVTGNLTFSGTAATNLTIGGTAIINGTTTFSSTGGITATGTPTIQGTLALGTTAHAIAVTSGTTDISALLTGSTGTTTKSGAGTLTLSGSVANTYSGVTTVSGGTLALSKLNGVSATQAIAGNLTVGSAGTTAAMAQYAASTANPDMMGAGTVTLLGRGILDFNGATDTIGNVTITATGAGASTTPIVNTAGGGNLTIGTLGITPLAGFNSVVNSGTGILTLGGNVTFTNATTGQAQISGTELALGGATRTFTVGLGTGTNQDLLINAPISGSGFGLTKAGTGRLHLTGNNTFNGLVTVSAGILAFSGNANVASPNPLGQSSAAAANLLLANGTTLRYLGAAASTDRGFTINGTAAAHGATLDASGTGPINFTSTASPAYGTIDQTRTLTLTGTATGANTLAANIGDNGIGAVSLSKSGGGTWWLSGTNTNTGQTNLSGGVLVLNSANALPGSGLRFTSGGVLGLGDYGTFTRLSGNATTPAAGTFAFGSDGGFAAYGADRMVNMGGAGGNVSFGGTANAVVASLNGKGMVLGAADATHTIIWMNGLDSGTVTRNLTVNDGLATVDAEIRGVLTSTTAGAGLNKNGTGTLLLSNANTLIGPLNINAGTVIVSNASALGASVATTIVANGAVLDLNGTSPALPYPLNLSGTGISSSGSLINSSATPSTYSGPVTFANATIRIGGTGIINLSNTSAIIGTGSSLTLAGAGGSVGGALQTGAGTLTVNSTGTWTLNGTNTYTGATSVVGGALALLGAAEINGSTSITVNAPGAKLLQNSSAAVTPTVTLTQGTVTGSGTINTVDVGAGTGGIISNNNGAAGASLTIGTLTFNGAATVNTFSNSISAPIATTTLATDLAGIVTINASSLVWADNTTHDLISYGGGSIGGTGGFGQFVRGTVTGLSARQAAALTLGDSGTAVTLAITGDTPYWTGDGDDTWNLTSVNNWSKVSDNMATTFLVNDNTLFNDSATAAGPIIVDIDAANVAPNSTVFTNSTKDYVLGSTGGFGITNGSLSKSGAGMLTINNANSYPGGTLLSGGTLRLGNANAIGSSLLTLNGGNLDSSVANLVNAGNNAQLWSSDFTFVGTQNLNLGTGAVTLSGNRTVTVSANNLTVGGSIGGGAVNLTKLGAGTLTLSGGATFTGTLAVNAGTVALSPVAAGGFTMSNALSGTGTLNVNPFAANSSNLSLTGNLSGFTGIVNVATSGGFNSKLATTGASSSFGATTVVNIASGATWANSSANQIGITVNIFGVGNSENLGALRLDGGTLDITSSVVLKADGSIGSVSGTTINAPISEFGGSFGFTKQGTGTIFLGGANTYTGLTTVSAGVLVLQNAAALGTTAGGTSLADGTRVELDGLTVTGEAITITGAGGDNLGALRSRSGSSVWTGPVTVNADLTRIGAITGTTMEVSGVIDDGVNDYRIRFRPNSATATIIVSGANTYTGGTSIFGGLVVASSFNSVVGGTASSSFGAPVTAANGLIILGIASTTNNATLSYIGAGETTDRTFQIGDNSATPVVGDNGAGAIENNGASGALVFSAPTFNSPTNAVTGTSPTRILTLGGTNTNANAISGIIQNNQIAGVGSAAVAVTKAGVGTWILSGANTYTGATSITTGTLQLDGSTHASSTVGIATAGTLSGSGTVNGNATLTGSGIINKSAGTIVGTLAVTGGNWNGAGSVTGLVTSSSGFFNIGSGANLTADGNLNVTGGSFAGTDATSTLTGSLNYTSATSSSFGGVIAGSGKTVTVNNAATTLTLGGTNTYDGATSVTAGTLVATSAAALGATTAGTTVTSGATLDVQANIGLEGITVGGTGVGGIGGLITSAASTGTVGGAILLTSATTLGGAGDLNINGAVGSLGGPFSLTKIGAGVTTFGAAPSGSLTDVDDLTAAGGTTNVNSVLGGGTSDVSVTGVGTKLRLGKVSQTLSSLTIGAGATVIFTSGTASGSFADGGGKAGGFGSPASSFSGSATVPEPGTIGLLLVGALGVLNRRRRQA